MTNENASGESHRAERETLAHLLRLTFADQAAADAWLRREVPLLGGERPCALIARGEIAPVIEVLAGLRAGSFG